MSVKATATLLLLGAMATCHATLAAAQNDIAVVVNPGNAVTNLSRDDLRKIFLGDKHSWPGGGPVKLIVRGPGSVERLALLRLLGMSESEYKQYWTARVFRGDSDTEPLMVPSIGMQMESLKVFPGAITLVIARDVKPSMKAIKVDNLLPGVAGYAIR